jgi:hypothetical protein
MCSAAMTVDELRAGRQLRLIAEVVAVTAELGVDVWLRGGWIKQSMPVWVPGSPRRPKDAEDIARLRAALRAPGAG